MDGRQAGSNGAIESPGIISALPVIREGEARSARRGVHGSLGTGTAAGAFAPVVRQSDRLGTVDLVVCFGRTPRVDRKPTYTAEERGALDAEDVPGP